MATVLKPVQSRRKADAAQTALRELALSLGANAKLPTVREICKAMKISAVTAEVVLSGLEEQGVLTRRQGSGMFVSPRLYQKSVGLVFGAQAFAPGVSPFCGLLIDGSRHRAESHNEVFSFYMDLPHHQSDRGCPVHTDLANALSKRLIDGILLSSRHSAEQENWLRSQRVPVVSFAGGTVHPVAPGNVGFDLHEMATTAAREMAARGCQRVAMISAHENGAKKFPLALEAAGLPYEARRVSCPLIDTSPDEPRMRVGMNAMSQLLAADHGGPTLDGVIVTDDMLATGAIAACEAAGLVIGRDIVLATHANRGSYILQGHEDKLIRVEVDPNEIVEAMFEMLEGMMNGKAPAPVGVAIKLSVHAGREVRPVVQ